MEMKQIADEFGNNVYVMTTAYATERNALNQITPIYGAAIRHYNMGDKDEEIEDSETSIFLGKEANLRYIQALEVAQKELDPSYQTREELQTQLTELLNRANG